MDTLTDTIRRYRDLLEEALEMYWLYLDDAGLESSARIDEITLKIMEELHPEKVQFAREKAEKYRQGFCTPGDLLMIILAFEDPNEDKKP